MKDKIFRRSIQYNKRIWNSRMIFSERLSFVKITKKVVNFYDLAQLLIIAHLYKAGICYVRQTHLYRYNGQACFYFRGGVV